MNGSPVQLQTQPQPGVSVKRRSIRTSCNTRLRLVDPSPIRRNAIGGWPKVDFQSAR